MDFIAAIDKNIPSNIRIYDGLGLLPKRDNYLGFVGPLQNKSNEASMVYVRSTKPEVIILVGRFYVLYSGFVDWVMKNYFEVAHGVWVREDLYKYETFKNLSEDLKPFPSAAFLFQFGTSY